MAKQEFRKKKRGESPTLYVAKRAVPYIKLLHDKHLGNLEVGQPPCSPSHGPTHWMFRLKTLAVQL